MKYCVLILSVFLLAACVTQKSAIQQSFQVPGDYKPKRSGLVFPEVVNSFRRVNIMKFDEKETDIGVVYNDPAHKISLTLYVYPSPLKSFGSSQDIADTATNKLFNNDYQRSKQDILNGYQNSQFIAERPYHLKKYEPHLGAHGIFKYNEIVAGKSKAVVSHLYLIQVDSKMFKYLATYPESRRNEKYIVQFIESIEMR